VPIGLILPVAIHLRVFYSETPAPMVALHLFLIAVGISAMLLALAMTIASWD
jgi:hypothetical protein